MGYMIQIEEESAMEMKEHAKKALKHMGKLMECVEELCEEGGSMGERGGGSYGNRGGGSYGGRYGTRGGNGGNGGGSYGNRTGYREDEDDEDWDDDNDRMGERRGRSSRTGRFVRR